MSWRQVQLLVIWSLLASVSLLALVGQWWVGWKGALLLPLGCLLVATLSLHVAIRGSLWLGMKAYDKGNLATAAGLLWLAEIPALRLYDRTGRRAAAFQKSREAVTAQMLQGALQGFLRP